MKITALRCDWEGCCWTDAEDVAKARGWLSVGGERRGRSRTDLCPSHARSVIAQVTMNLSTAAKKRAAAPRKKIRARGGTR